MIGGHGEKGRGGGDGAGRGAAQGGVMWRHSGYIQAGFGGRDRGRGEGDGELVSNVLK